MTRSLIFISYSRQDEAEKDQLLSHLGVLQHAGLIDLWSDDRIVAGADWQAEIDQAIAQARVAILLITADFLTSDFILGQEIPALLHRREQEGLIILPVIAKACAWSSVDWLARLIDTKPERVKPIWRGQDSHVDEALAAIAEQVAKIVQGEQPDLETAIAGLTQPGEKQTGSSNQSGVQINVGDQFTGDIIVGGEKVLGDKKNIIQIGSLVVPTIPLIVIAVSLLGIMGLVLYRLVVPVSNPTPIANSAQNSLFNVVVADFGQIAETGQLQRSVEGQQISDRIYNGLQEEFDSLPVEIRQDFQPEIWHDRLHPLEGGSNIGLIPNQTAAAELAQKMLAQKIRADVIIYGHLKLDGDSASFTPQFYVPALKGEAEEMVGQHQFGGPIPIQSSPGQEQQTALVLNIKLLDRSKALARFTLGLMYDFMGGHQDALEVFQQAINELDLDTENSGQELFYYFIGRSALFLKKDQEAQTAFETALKVSDNQYIRAYIGLGGVYLTRAQTLPPDQRLETTDLQQAIDSYQEAFDRATEPHLKVIAQLALGMAHRLKGEAYFQLRDDEKAISLFDQAIAEIQATLEPLQAAGQYRYLGQAYLSLGAAYDQQAHIRQERGDKSSSIALYEKALEAYANCIGQQQQAAYDETLTQKIIANGCEPYKKSSEEALAVLKGEP